MANVDYSKLTNRQLTIINEVMDTFDFSTVANHMKATDWYYYDKDYKSYIPDEKDLKKLLRSLLVSAYIGKNKENRTEVFYQSTGGFTIYICPNDICQVFFAISEVFIDEYDIKNEQ